MDLHIPGSQHVQRNNRRRSVGQPVFVRPEVYSFGRLREKVEALELSAALVSACEKGDVSEVCSLIDRGADVNFQGLSWYGNPMIVACKHGHTQVVQVLIKAGAKLEAHKGLGPTPLTAACEQGHIEVVQVLINAGAKLETNDGLGQTPLIAACGHGHAELVQVLIKAGAKLEARDLFGQTPLSVARDNGHTEIVRVLIKEGALQLEGSLMLACTVGNSEAVQRLLALGAHLALTDSDGYTALALASRNGFLEIVQALLRAGARAHIYAHHFKRAMKLATENGHTEVAKIIHRAELEEHDKRKAHLQVLHLIGSDGVVLLFCFSLRELVSLLKCLRTGWGPPLELVMRRLNSKFWVMEADLWADLLKICRWANPTTITKQDVLCAICEDVWYQPQSTIPCGHTFCAKCIHSQLKSGVTQCPKCQQPMKPELIPNQCAETLLKLYYDQKEIPEEMLLQYRPVVALVGQKRERKDSAEPPGKKQKSTSEDLPDQNDAQPIGPQNTLSLKTLYPALLPAKSTWFNLGIALGVDYDTLSGIRTQFKEDCSDCLRETLQCRLTDHEKPALTINEVAEALKSPTVRRGHLAKRLLADKTL